MQNVSRRSFVGAVGGMAIAGAAGAAALSAGAVEVAKADAAAMSHEGTPLTVEEANAIRQQLVDSKTEDYVCADGTTIPVVYVKLRTLIDSFGLGLGSEVHDHSWDELMMLFTEETAQYYLEIPRGVWFTATDYSVASGRDEAECGTILADLAGNGLLMRADRGGVDHFHILAEAHGIWEYNMYHYDLEYTTAHQTQWGADIIDNLYNSETPFYYPIPVNRDIVSNESILPYDDYEAIIARNSILSVSPCQCRLRRQVMEDYTEAAGGVECSHPVETCIATGEEAEYYIANGIGRQITQEEALQILQTSVDAGMVIQSAYSKNTEVICSCHGDCCDILASYVALGSEGCASMNSFPNLSHYTLEVDTDACLKCGACAERCPLYAITMDETTGLPTVNDVCVRCGQCATVCPAEARKLTQKADEEILELPVSMLDDYNLKGGYRLAANKVY